jgi:hypothetical protein
MLSTAILSSTVLSGLAARPAFAEVPAKAKPHGLVLVSAPAKDAQANLLHWQLAQRLYGRPGLQPQSLTEAQARTYLGEPASAQPVGAEPAREQLQGENLQDEGQRAAVLLSIAHAANAEGCVLVRPLEPGQSVAQLFLAKSGKWAPGIFSSVDWTQALDAFEAELGKDPEHQAIVGVPSKKPAERSSFYQSGWFWAAVGGAVVLGGLAFILTQTKSSSPSAPQAVTTKTATTALFFRPTSLGQTAGFSW